MGDFSRLSLCSAMNGVCGLAFVVSQLFGGQLAALCTNEKYARRVVLLSSSSFCKKRYNHNLFNGFLGGGPKLGSVKLPCFVAVQVHLQPRFSDYFLGRSPNLASVQLFCFVTMRVVHVFFAQLFRGSGSSLFGGPRLAGPL